METVQGGMLLIYTLIAIVALIVMIAKFRIYPFFSSYYCFSRFSSCSWHANGWDR